jgi:hypothetical protein
MEKSARKHPINMENNLLINILSSFSQDAFAKFTYEMWTSNDIIGISKDIETHYRPSISRYAFEQYQKIYTTPDKLLIDKKLYTLVLPFFYPLELFQRPDEALRQKGEELYCSLKKYKKIVNRRHNGWLWTVDGMYYIPNIAFVSNYYSLKEDAYQELLFPFFETLIDNLEIDAVPAIGSIDSFLELAKEDTERNLGRFIENYKSGISISFKDEIRVNEFISEKYLTSGVLPNSLSPCESIFQISNNNEIIKEFEHLISDNTKEVQLELFLKDHFQTIFGEEYDRIETQLWLKFPELDIINSNRRINLFLRNAVHRDWELVELKKANVSLIRKNRDIPAFTKAVHDGIQQLLNYKNILNQDIVKKKFAMDGIEYCIPDLRLVIGRDPDIPIAQWRSLKASNENNLKITTYTELLNGLKRRYDKQNHYYK